MPKIDGYRLIAWRDGSRVRLFTRLDETLSIDRGSRAAEPADLEAFS